MKKLPIGIQTFSKIREGNYCYVDKTPLIAQMVETGEFYFLARPRRFGKSLLVDTIAEAFLGNKELFVGLHLENNWEWERKHPVIRIDFAESILDSRTRLDEKICLQLEDIALQYQVQLEREEPSDKLNELIRKLHQKVGQRVVVLVDEYDKPILDNITVSDTAEALRDGLRNFYSVLKAQGAHLRFVMLTGVSKFSKVSLFSGLNNLEDITLDARFGNLCGYTRTELKTVLGDYLHDVDLTEIKKWYNGYNFLGELVYNPYDVLLYLRNREFKPYWFETGTPTFLIQLFKSKKSFIPSFENLIVGENLLNSFDVDFIEPETLLFQTGYLTIKKKYRMAGQIRYQLGFPNFEVQTSLTDSILNRFIPDIQQKERTYNEIYQALQVNDLPRLKNAFHAFFASIPHDWHRKNNLAGYEGYYCSVVYCYFTALGLKVCPEDTTNHGRIDMSVFFENRVYKIEFKVNELTEPGRALAQIKEKRYYEKFADDENREIYLIGVEFNAEERNISRFEWERYQ